jgi:hypothetical protein
MFTCEYCKKEYANLSVLNYHQKTTNFCLKIQNSIKDKNEQINDIFTCEYCKKEFNTKFKLISHHNNCKQKDIDELKKEYEDKLNEVRKEKDDLKKEYEDKLNEVRKEKDDLKKEYEEKFNDIKKELEKHIEFLKKENEVNKLALKKEIECKNEHIQSLKDQLNKYIEKNTSTVNTVNNNQIINTVNIREEEINKNFLNIKAMIPGDIRKSMEQINYYQMFNNVEPMDKYFIKNFVENFKDYMFTTDGSRGTIVIKLENGNSDKIKAVQFILICFKIGEAELKRLFMALTYHIKGLLDMEDITPDQYLSYIKNLNDLKVLVLEQKSNKFVNKLASELIKRGRIVKNKILTDNKVIENEILKLS